MPFSPYLAEGGRIGLRPCRPTGAAEFTARVRESRELHHRWLSPPATVEAYEAYAAPLIAGAAGAAAAGRAGFLVCERESGAVAGFVNVNNIVRGAFCCGALGYGAFAHAAGRGLMREALGLAVGHAFAADGLAPHRLEADIQPGSTASIALVRGLGFRREGLSPDFLHVGGARRDHGRWAITAEMPCPGSPHRTG